ncbi:hypothetical protein [Bacillus sp. 123MFChir2]|uniref:hypothetical protein n=1 Tax=Bacillus sp. 123MFChir2 TaxID=1169144 RepID=UPI0012DE3DD5|nr:hypothetical protein [Bacillus sp. 123MFChir2]
MSRRRVFVSRFICGIFSKYSASIVTAATSSVLIATHDYLPLNLLYYSELENASEKKASLLYRSISFRILRGLRSLHKTT